MKNKNTRKSRGVAFIQYHKERDAQHCVHHMDRKRIFGRFVKCSMAHDNGRTGEFIKKKHYLDKRFCYECGQDGHLSYNCPNNMLGSRAISKKKLGKKFHGRKGNSQEYSSHSEEEDDEANITDNETLSAAIQMEANKLADTYKEYNTKQKLKIRQHAYFSDEEEDYD